MTIRTLPSRTEWAAAAEEWVRSFCLPSERVSSRPQDWLTPDELGELHDLAHDAVDAARRTINGTIRGILPAFRDEPKRTAARLQWADTLDDRRRPLYERLRLLRSDRLHLNGGLRRGTSDYATVDDINHSIGRVIDYALRYDAPASTVDRLAALVARLLQHRDGAAQTALDAAIREEVAKRNSDEGWAKELERRARIGRDPILFVSPA
ncbi:hypothetical protein [Streptomyces sp. 4N124]|uniref:hypothetical protein n=1 Tax=Streptomyces sp. 4N124 TaxID=3457420 RepID=UPI003FCF9661